MVSARTYRPSRQSPRRSRRPAFTLMEVLVSIALLAIALFGVLGSIAYGTRHSATGEELTEASHIARQLLVAMQETTAIDRTDITERWLKPNSGLNDAGDVRRTLDAAPLGGVTFTTTQLGRYTRRIVTTRTSEQPSDHRYGLANVTVEIFWLSKHGPTQLRMTGVVTHARP